MQAVPVSLLHPVSRARTRTALVASADRSFRQRIAEILTGLRWQVRETEGGAQTWTEAELATPEAVIVDSWLPDLDLAEFLTDFRGRFPQVDLVTASGTAAEESPRGPYRQELLYALRRSQDTDTAVWNVAPVLNKLAAPAGRSGPTTINGNAALSDAWPLLEKASQDRLTAERPGPEEGSAEALALGTVAAAADGGLDEAAKAEFAASDSSPNWSETGQTSPGAGAEMQAAEPNPVELGAGQFRAPDSRAASGRVVERLPELIGNASCMLEVSRRIRLVADRMTPVLIEGPTGSGKELVAEALHRLSSRSRKPFVAINCAAIPETLLEAELFGHTRGAFTGAVQGRVGRIESADGGTLFLDEIGEMPLALQSKLLRFVESSELQRVGGNETIKVDVRIVAATHRPLAEHTQTGVFRSDLYYRLAVFLIRTPSLAEHAEDLPLLVQHFLEKMGREEPLKRIDPGAMAKLAAHGWPGNVRELEHVLERAAILAGEEPLVTAREIDFGLSVN
jgi:DNA-binding NtrC family response regulator